MKKKVQSCFEILESESNVNKMQICGISQLYSFSVTFPFLEVVCDPIWPFKS